jgi:hypothetical protein
MLQKSKSTLPLHINTKSHGIPNIAQVKIKVDGLSKNQGWLVPGNLDWSADAAAY